MNKLRGDLDLILEHTQPFWDRLRNQNIFITGGTGWFGCWLLESLIYANEQLGTNIHPLVLTRNPSAFIVKAPHLALHPCVTLQRGDANDFYFVKDEFRYVIHAEMSDIPNISEEARKMLEFASYMDIHSLLFTSSGAACHETKGLTEYGKQKKQAEDLFLKAYVEDQFPVKLARCYTFVGPYMPLDQYAIGQFIFEGLKNNNVILYGGDHVYRSYLYTADLIIWLLRILVAGIPGKIYDVGSPVEYSIAAVAKQIANIFSCELITHIGEDIHERYVPDVHEAEQDLGLKVYTPFPEAVKKTIEWYRYALS